MSDGRSSAAGETPHTLLLVESNPLVRHQVAAHFRKHRFGVIEAASGDEALDLLRARRIAHLVLSNLELSGKVQGLELVEILKREFPHLKVVLGSGGGDRPAGWLVLARPYDLDEAAAVVRRLLAEP